MAKDKLTDEQMTELQEVFGIFDIRGDQKISAHQIGEVLRACGLNPTEHEWKKYVGTEAEKRLDFNTFLPIYQTVAKIKVTSTPEDFIEGFRVFDNEQNGFIGSAELRHLLTNLGERMTEEECELLLQGYEDAQGNVNYEELVRGVVYNQKKGDKS